MKIQIASDLHLEFLETFLETPRWQRAGAPMVPEHMFRAAPGRDVLVLAGDIGVRDAHMEFVLAQADISPVVYVPGNHEYYTVAARSEVDFVWREASAKHADLHYLTGEPAEIGGVRFFGAPFYSSLGVHPPDWYLRDVESSIRDFDPRHSCVDRWTARRHTEAHAEQVEQLLEAAAEAPVDVVVTHWPPVRCAIARRYKGNAFNPYFVNDLEPLVEKVGAQAWISGHVHDPYDADIRGTRCIGNPFGYPDRTARGRPGFSPDKVIEIEGPRAEPRRSGEMQGPDRLAGPSA